MSQGHNRGGAVWRRHGFTLTELLVIIAIVAILTAVLVPTLARAKERGRRAVCANNVRQFIVQIHAYASENTDRLPSGLSNHGEDEHTPILSSAMYDALVGSAGDIKFLTCPWLKDPFTNSNSWYYQQHGDYGYLLGYNYLGGHAGTPWPLTAPATSEWISPQTSSDRGTAPVVTELNAWSTGKIVTFTPHGKRGPINNYSSPGAGSSPPQDIGAEGGNVGLLDGSTSWKNIEAMKIYIGSRQCPADGCLTMW